ncbi:unnamed protein product [Cuscuta campestris]|uniref:Reverse transcriptase domain-containing protein n=1 Tax=Cuscuta campestris TaxID=132261 RepID=A0A484MAT2_9ASTE|nr:unnamed protein product [Cuscuta campestris]
MAEDDPPGHRLPLMEVSQPVITDSTSDLLKSKILDSHMQTHNSAKMELQALALVPEASSSLIAPLKANPIAKIVEVEDISHEDFPPLSAEIKGYGKMASTPSENYVNAFRTYVKHLLAMGKTEEALEFVQRYSPSSILSVSSYKPECAQEILEPIVTKVPTDVGNIASSSKAPAVKSLPPTVKSQAPSQFKSTTQLDGKTNVVLPKLSYAQTVAPHSAPVPSLGNMIAKLPDRNVIMHRDTPAIRFAEEEIENLSRIDRFTLVGKFSHGQPKLEVIRKHFATQYVLKGQVTIGLRGPRHVFHTFTNSQDCTDILLKNQIAFNGANPMRLFRSTLDFNTETETSIAPVWILLHGLPIHFFDITTLTLVCKPLGKVLGVDQATLNKSRPHVARVRVELDLMQPLIQKVFIGTSMTPRREDEGFYQSIEYERISFYCSKCLKQGHSTDKCKLGEEQHIRAEKIRKGKYVMLETTSKPDTSKAPSHQIPQSMKYVPKVQNVKNSETTATRNHFPHPTPAPGQDTSFQVVHKKQHHQQKTTTKTLGHKESQQPKQFALTPTISIIPKNLSSQLPQSAPKPPLGTHSNSFGILEHLSEDQTVLNPKAPEFHPSQIALGVLQQLELQPVDQHGVQFPVLPIPHPPEQLKSAENTSANTIPSNKIAMLEELDPGPKTIEEDTEEMWSDEGEQMLLVQLLEDTLVFLITLLVVKGRYGFSGRTHTSLVSLLMKNRQFSFLHAWTTHPNFIRVVQKAWSMESSGPPMTQFSTKLLATRKALNIWNKEVFGNIFTKLEALEKKVQEAEETYQIAPTDENLMHFKSVDAQYLHQLHLEELFWKQKAHVQWVVDGDINSKYFHALVKARRRKLYIHKIKGLDAIILLPKVDSPNTFADFRAISLCNFSSKIISKVLDSRLAGVLPHIISPSQSGFIQGRSITENILLLLTQELCHGMQLQHRDIFLKLDLAKAYDRVSWAFLNKIQRQMGFCEQWIDMVFRMVSNIWYTVLVNGQREGFFTSSRGLRQGDPLSPGLGTNKPDKAIWKPRSNGLFTLKAAKHFMGCNDLIVALVKP